jgi:hypothetical protein
MDIHVAHVTFQALPNNSVQQGATMVAKCQPFVRVHRKSMRYIDIEPLTNILCWFGLLLE